MNEVRRFNLDLCVRDGCVWFLAPISELPAMPTGQMECARCHSLRDKLLADG